MVRLFAYLRLTPDEGDPLTLSYPVWVVEDPVYSSGQREHSVATNKGFFVEPLLDEPGELVVQAVYEPQRGLAPGARRDSPWHGDLGTHPGPTSVKALKGQIVLVEWAGLMAPMHFRNFRMTSRRYLDSASNEPAGAPLRSEIVLTFRETDPARTWL